MINVLVPNSFFICQTVVDDDVISSYFILIFASLKQSHLRTDLKDIYFPVHQQRTSHVICEKNVPIYLRDIFVDTRTSES